ncbi:DUF695 domain-containing protein [Tenacibaculum aiptasiae]|uniref:DUF695 domain-containing protein n=1 Tax=Tenacibaculum aiptasiae TaxID=426481 RepID=UPI00232CE7D4|nr:DUF695 domain-containing protein [Tenacibaculum aiptasiae]
MRILKKLLGKEKNESINSYEDFWNWFIENEKKFFNVIKRGGAENISLNFFDKISPKLDQLKEGIWYLTGMVNDDIADLILTSDGDIKNYYLIEELIAAAPKLPNWKFQAHKPSSDIDDVAIDMGGFKFRKENIFFYENEVKSCPDEIDITIIHKDYSEKNKDEIINGCYIFLENFLGELEVITVIDNIEFTSNEEQEKELVPIEKLKDFLIWREKEFIEKYDGVRYNTSEDSYISLETKLKNGNTLLAIMNSDLLAWDETASHPWIMKIKIPYEGEKTRGFPNDSTYSLLNNIEEDIMLDLKDYEGFLNVGRETGDNIREVFFACKDYRKASKVIDQIKIKYQSKIEINYEIFKDKYWTCFNWHRKSL